MPQAGGKPMTAANPCSLGTQIGATKEQQVGCGTAVVPPELCSTKASVLAAAEHCGDNKSWALAALHDWELNYF